MNVEQHPFCVAFVCVCFIRVYEGPRTTDGFRFEEKNTPPFSLELVLKENGSISMVDIRVVFCDISVMLRRVAM